MANKDNLSVGISFYAHLDKLKEAITKGMADIEKSLLEKGELTDVFKNESVSIRKELDGVVDYVKSSYDEISKNKLDAKTFEEFEAKIKKRIENVITRISALEKSFEKLELKFAALDNTGELGGVNKVMDQFSSLKESVESANTVLQSMIEIASKVGVDFGVIDSEKYQQTEDMLEDISNALDAINEKSNVKISTYTSKDMRVANKDLIDAIQKVNNIQDKIEELNNDDALNDFDRAESLSMEATKYVKAYQKVIAIRNEYIKIFGNDSLQKLIKDEYGFNPFQDIEEYYSLFPKELEKARAEIQKAQNNLIKEIGDVSVEIGRLEFRNNKIVVPVEINTTQEQLSKRVIALIDGVQNAVKDKGIEVKVKYVAPIPKRDKKDLLAMQEQISSLPEGELRDTAKRIHDSLSSTFKEDIGIRISSNIVDTERSISAAIHRIEELAGAAKVKINPSFEIADADKKKLADDYMELVNMISMNLGKDSKDLANNYEELIGAISLNVGDDAKKISDTLTKILRKDTITKWADYFIEEIKRIFLFVDSLRMKVNDITKSLPNGATIADTTDPKKAAEAFKQIDETYKELKKSLPKIKTSVAAISTIWGDQGKAVHTSISSQISELERFVDVLDGLRRYVQFLADDLNSISLSNGDLIKDLTGLVKYGKSLATMIKLLQNAKNQGISGNNNSGGGNPPSNGPGPNNGNPPNNNNGGNNGNPPNNNNNNNNSPSNDDFRITKIVDDYAAGIGHVAHDVHGIYDDTQDTIVVQQRLNAQTGKLEETSREITQHIEKVGNDLISMPDKLAKVENAIAKIRLRYDSIPGETDQINDNLRLMEDLWTGMKDAMTSGNVGIFNGLFDNFNVVKGDTNDKLDILGGLDKSGSFIDSMPDKIAKAKQSMVGLVMSYNNLGVQSQEIEDNLVRMYNEIDRMEQNTGEIPVFKEAEKSVQTIADLLNKQIANFGKQGDVEKRIASIVTLKESAQQAVNQVHLDAQSLSVKSSDVGTLVGELDDALKTLTDAQGLKEQEKAAEEFAKKLKQVRDILKTFKSLNAKAGIKGVDETIAKFKKLSTGDGKIDSYKLLYKDLSDIIQQMRDIEDKMATMDLQTDEFEKARTELAGFKKQADELIAKLNNDSFNLKNNLGTVVSQNIKDVAEARQRVGDLTASMNRVGDIKMDHSKEGMAKFTVKVKEADGAVQDMIYTFDAATGTIRTWGKMSTAQLNIFGKFVDSLKKKFVSMATYLLSFGSVHELWQIFRQGITVVRELDDALTEMRKVSKSSLSTLKEFQKESFDIAKNLGTTAQVLQNSTADWLRLGETLNEAKQSAQDATLLFNVSEFQSIDEATDSLVSMSQAYKDLEKGEIVDVLNNVGNNFAISTDGLATALQSSAAALSIAGNNLYEAVALATAGNAVVQDPARTGSGIRTIALRIQGTQEAKDELASLGEDVDDFVVQTQSKLDEQVRKYTAVASNNFDGVSLLDENGNYRSTYQILQDIADIYDEIVETDKKAGTNRMQGLLELLAGKNRSNIAASIISNADLLRDVYESASTESEGSAQKELENYLDSISGKIAQLENQIQELASVAFDSELIKNGVDLLTTLLSLLTDLVDKVGLFKPLVGGGGLIAFFKSLDCPELRGQIV